MSFCSHCGKETIEGNSFCIYCGEKINSNTNSVITLQMSSGKTKNNKNFILLFAFGIVAIVAVAGMVMLGGKSYEKVAKDYINGLLAPDYIKLHETTIFNEEYYDMALTGYYNEKAVGVGDIYTCLSNEYYVWNETFDNYKSFYNGLSEYDKSEHKGIEYEILEINYKEMTDEELENVCYQYNGFQQSYLETYNLDSNQLIDFSKVTKGYVATAKVLTGEKETIYDIYIIKYNGRWCVADCLCLERMIGQDLFSISVLKERISDEKLEATLLSMNYQVTPYSINIGRVLPRCSPDYEIEFLKYDDAKNDMLTQSQTEKIEQSGVWDTENIYFAVVTGTCIYNPTIPDYGLNYKSEEQILMKIMLVFNDDEELINDVELYLSQDVISYAVTGNYVDIVF